MQLASEVIAYQLQSIGITSATPSEPASTWVENVITNHDEQAFVCGLVSGLDPDQHLFRYFDSTGLFNFSQYPSTPTLDRLLLEGRETINPAKRSRSTARRARFSPTRCHGFPSTGSPGSSRWQPRSKAFFLSLSSTSASTRCGFKPEPGAAQRTPWLTSARTRRASFLVMKRGPVEELLAAIG